MREYLNKFNKFRKDPKKKSISLLIIYGIFFIFVFVYISGTKPINNPNEINNIITSVSNYEYEIEFNINNEIININGTYLNNENKINIDNKYNIVDNVINYNNIIINTDLIINKFNYNSLDNFLKNYEYDSKTEYKDGNTKYEYNISNKDIANYLKEDIKEGNTTIQVYKKDYINEISIDLSNYYNSSYMIKIKYNNINNIKSINN